MFRFTYQAIGRCAVTAVCGLVLLAQTSATSQESSAGIAKELEIMSKVLEASLDASGIEDWHASSIGYSAFQSKIRREYIPTVGAIFTIDVNFPIVKPEEEVAKPAQAEKDPHDLWEQMAEAPARDWWSKNTPEEITGIGVSLLKDDEGEIVVVNTYIDSPAANADIKQYDVIVEVDGQETRTLELSEVSDLIGGPEGSPVTLRIRSTDDANTVVKLERAKIKLNTNRTFHFDPQDLDAGSYSLRFGDENKTLFLPFDQSNQSPFQLLRTDDLNLTLSDGYFFRGIEYDAKKVGSLRDTLIAAVARYGHRMTQVGDEERILIIVNAPRGGSSNRLVSLDEQKRGITYIPVASHKNRDRILFSFAQSDLQEETSPEILKQVVQELSY